LSEVARGLTQRTIGGLFWTSVGAVVQAILQLVALAVLARLLSPSEFGMAAAALVVIGFSVIFSQVGVGPAIVQCSALEPRHLRTGFTLSLLLSLVVAGSVWAAADLVAAFFRMQELGAVVRTICPIFICRGLSTVAESLAQRELRFRWLAAIEVGAFAGGFIIIGTTLAWLGYGIWALVGAHLMQNIARTAGLLAGQPHAKRLLLDRHTVGELLYFGGGFTLARVGNYLAGQGDNLVVGRWLGAQALGLYTYAYYMMATPAQLIGQVFDRVLFPTMAQVQSESERLTRAYRSGLATMALLILPVSVTLAIVAPEVILVLLGPKWAGVVGPFRIFALGMLFRTSYKLSDSLTRATGAVYSRAWRQGIYAVAVVTGAWAGHHWGLAGVAVGVLAAIAINFALMAQLSLGLTGMRWSEFGAAHVPALALTAVVGVSTWIVATYLRELQVTPIMLLVSITLWMPAMALILCWCMPQLFLGKDGQWLLRSLLASAPLQRPQA
jgi:O-antigen/teichoic acid export membrane protein